MRKGATTLLDQTLHFPTGYFFKVGHDAHAGVKNVYRPISYTGKIVNL